MTTPDDFPDTILCIAELVSTPGSAVQTHAPLLLFQEFKYFTVLTGAAPSSYAENPAAPR